MAAFVSTGGAVSDWTRHRNKALLVLAGLLAIFCYAPALRAYFAQDDFTLLTLVRLLQQPLLVFYHDHFPGSLFFRPLGVFLWWLTTAAFDNAPRGHYVVNLALHLGVVLALYTLLQRLRRDAPLNAVWAAVFAVHPLAIGTALWLSDRFDLIATGFSLLALTAALAYAQRPRVRNLAAMLACVLLAFMGKEIAIVGALAAAALIALPNRGWPLTPAQRWTAVAAIAALIVAWLGYRQGLQTNPQNLLLHTGPLLAMFTKGFLLWLRVGMEYLVLDPRQATWMTTMLSLGALLLVIAAGLNLRDHGWRPQTYGIAAAVVILILLPGPTQAPVVYLSMHDFTADKFWFDVVGESRLYHLSLAGLVIGLMLLTNVPAPAAHGGRAAMVNAVVASGLALMLVAWVPDSHALARDYARRTREQIAPLQSAQSAIASLALPPRHCQIYLLDAGSIWGLDINADATIKATSPSPERLEHCLVSTERTPWGSFFRSGSVGPADYAPLRVLNYQGKPIPWIRVGGLEVAYLNLDADIDARAIDGAFFLEYRDGAFVDVSAQVRSGARPVRFFNARPDEK